MSPDGVKSYKVEIRLKGCPAQRNTFKRLTDARKWVQDTESAIREGRYFKTIEAKKHTFGDMVDRYIKDVLPKKTKQAPAQRPQLERWKAELGFYVLSDITPALIVECRDKFLTETTPRGNIRTPATVVRYMAALSHAFTIAVNEWQWLDSSPMSKVKKPIEPRGRVRFLDDEERVRFLKACEESSSPILYTSVILALSTGMRHAELMGLKWADVNLKEGYLILHDTKNGLRRRVTLSGLALTLLQSHAKIRRIDTPLLFPSYLKPQQPINLKKSFTNARKRAQVDDFKWHDLRHCAGSYLAMDGATPIEIAEILGHKSLNMVRRYSHLSESHVSNVVASMNAKMFGDV
jgi:integrase